MKLCISDYSLRYGNIFVWLLITTMLENEHKETYSLYFLLECEGKIDFSVATYSTKGFIVICTEDKIVMWDERLKSMVRSIPHPKTLQDAKTVDMKVFVSISWDNHIRVWGISREDMSNKPTLQVIR